MKKLRFSIFVGFLILMLSVGSAFSFTLGGYTGPIELKFSDFTQGTLYSASSSGYGNANGTPDSYSIFKVATIKTDPGSVTLWSDPLPGVPGEELAGILYGLDDDFWTITSTGAAIESVAGKIDLWLQPAGNFSAVLGPNPSANTGTYPGIGIPGGVATATLFFSGDLVPIVKATNGNPADNHITFANSLDFTKTPITGDGSFYIDLTGGAYQSLFDSNQYGGGLADGGGLIPVADLFAQFDSKLDFPYGFLASSEDPVGGTAVPEPAIMLLLGSGLIGFAFFGRKKLVN